jgi:hypothetical protein
MDREDFFDGNRSRPRCRSRQIRIGDLVFGVAMIAIGLSSLGAPEFTDRQRLFLGLFAVAFLTLLGAQWALASFAHTQARPIIGTLVGVVSAAMALSMFICLFVVGLFFPHAAASLSIMALLQVVYLITWE